MIILLAIYIKCLYPTWKNYDRRPDIPENKSMKFMQIYMMAMIMMFGLVWPSAMALYWAINSLVNIIKTLVVQKIIDKNNENKKGAR